MADKTLDCSGLSCPMPIIKVSQAIKEITSGQTLEITASDSAFEPDITAWAKKTGNSIVSIDKHEAKIVAVIKKH
ncbi:MAG: sulfurtransferase TusA family protein [Chitinivibrionales bacterium]|nr:sulfurtransferase TusA family protein [Chitinivibrionales bacterium]